MSRGKMKLSPKERLAFVERCLRNEASINSLAKEVGVTFLTLKSWINLYENEEPTGLLSTKKNKRYAKELKLNAVHDYLSGKGSLTDIAKKYGLRQGKQLRD